MKPFTTKKEACDAAIAQDLTGLFSGGQSCGPVPVDLGNGLEWIYETAHNVWGGDPVGEAIFSDETVSKIDPRFVALFG